MAARSPRQAVSSSYGLNEDDLVSIYEPLYPVRTKYINFGLLIGVKNTEIEDITAEQSDSGKCLLKILSVRLKKTTALTWGIIDKALRSPIVGELQLADTLQRTHYSKGGDPLSCPSTSDQEPQQKREKGIKQKRKYKKDAPTQHHSEMSEDDSDEEVGEVKRGLKKAKRGSKYSFLSGKGTDISKKAKTKVKRCPPSPATQEGEGAMKKGKKRKQNIKFSEYRRNAAGKEKSTKGRKSKRKMLPEKKRRNIKLLTTEGLSSDISCSDPDDEQLCSSNIEVVSNGEEEASEPAEDSSEESATSFREVKKGCPDTRSRKKGKVMYRRKGKRKVAIASSEHEFSGDEELRPHGSNWDQPRKRGRKRCKESSMSSTAVESSYSPASLQEQRYKVKRKRGICRKSKDRRGEERERQSVSSSTEMDDSSPECDMLKNISESQTQKLRKIFKCSFGKLCCTITEPVKTAAELQGKRLVSLSTMKDMVASPESQQVKIIALINALYRKIKSRSDRIFTIIEIFLKSDVLHEVGRKLWFEAGTIILPMYEFTPLCHKILLFWQEKCVPREHLLSLAVSYPHLLLADSKLCNLPQLLVSVNFLTVSFKFIFNST